MKMIIEKVEDFIEFIEVNELFKNKFFLNESMQNHTTIRIGGFVSLFVQVDDHIDLLYVLRKCIFKIPIYFIGKGSKILFSSDNCNCIIFKFIENKEKIYVKEDYIYAFAGTKLNTLIYLSYKNNLKGFDSLAGIPASVGGSIIMNCGTNYGNISNLVEKVVISDLNGNIKKLKRSECLFSYRNSIFRCNKNCIILYVLFKLEHESENFLIKNQIKKIIGERISKQPMGHSFGSTFCNPKEFSAGWLIESVGLKGYKKNGASISVKHSNFIINEGGATSNDVLFLIHLIKNKVYARHGIKLNLEVEYIF